MTLPFKFALLRKVALAMAVIQLAECAWPATVWALTSGPAQPEFASFEPVATTNMVNDFTGDFTYNLPVLEVPGANGGGYAMSLAYHSGSSPEEEASWVGYGWSLNPGVINRQKRGTPDDFSKKKVLYHNKMPKNWTVGVGGSIGNIEAISIDVPLSVNAELRYNNYKGLGYTLGAGVTLAAGTVSLGYNISDGEGSFSASVNPAAYMADKASEGQKGANDHASHQSAIGKSKQMSKMIGASGINLLGSNYGMFSYSDAVRATSSSAYKGETWKLSVSVMPTPSPIEVGVNFSLWGSYSWQQSLEAPNLDTYGYLYSAEAKEGDMMDYYVEKSTPYQKRDLFLGLPFNNADNFSVSGEGLGGGFRFYNKKPGHFHPNHQKSEVSIFQLGVEVEAGLNIGAGVDLGIGSHSLEIGSWKDPGNTGQYTFAKEGEDEFAFARFNNDLGGNVLFSDKDGSFSGHVNQSGGVPGAKTASIDINSADVYQTVNKGKRSGRSSYIAYHTNAEMADDISGKRFRAYTRDNATNAFVNRDEVGMEKSLGELVTFNEDGNRYVYGLPVYARNEKNLQYSLNSGNATVEKNYLAYRDIAGNNEPDVILGDESATPYSTAHLLTEITTADYVDRAMDGPTPDDFGGYTKFNYVRQFGPGKDGASPDKLNSPSNQWFTWRTPYKGLLYHKNEMSDTKDDLGSVMTGEKEIYYLKSVETKTHVAYFVLGNTDAFLPNGIHLKGSGEARKDGKSASEHTLATQGKDSPSLKQLQKLERIELYAKDENGAAKEKIKTVYFQYDYSLCKGLPNADAGQGKLTLKKVWTEYGNIVNAKISPYTFVYQYPAIAYPAPYQNLLDGYNNLSAAEQNPNYNPINLDAWGNYQDKGEARHNLLRNWVDQAPQADTFDPAAWQLKQIQLPSGGQIHVQYEQKDYHHVQDRLAMGMVSLLPGKGNGQSSANKFYLNVAELGVVTKPEKDELYSLIYQQYMNSQERIHFKFYYSLLTGLSESTVADGLCNGEFIEGYAKVKNVGKEANGDIFLQLEDSPLPEKICREFLKANRAGKLNPLGNCDASNGIKGDGSPTEIVMAFLGFAGSMAEDLIPGLDFTCKLISPQDSYFRIPLAKDKKGGGVRVKRLLMYDNGMEAGDEVLYGNEYVYQTTDEKGKVISSGVALNEPASIHEENALVGFLPRFEQSFLDKLIAGRDKKVTEGPIGESILPGASIGYSKVIQKNIHAGKTNTGFVVKEFFTAKDYPYDMHYKNLNENGADFSNMDKEDDWILVPAGLVNVNVSNLWLAQGFNFIINSMHGQIKSVATYAGDYNNVHDANKNILASQQVFEYFQPGEQIPFFKGVNAAVEMGDAGKEMDVTFENRSVRDIYEDGNIEIDLDAGIFFTVVIPFASAFPSYTYSESILETHTNTKVTRYPVIRKSVQTLTNGISSRTDFVAFDKATGQPVVTQTYDGFNAVKLGQAQQAQEGTYRSQAIPASSQYEAMGQKASNERVIIPSDATVNIAKVVNGKYYLKLSNPGNGAAICANSLSIGAGDMIVLSYDKGNGPINDGVYHVGEADYDGIPIFPTSYFPYTANQFDGATIEVIRSGRTNQLNQKTGSVVTYGAPQAVVSPPNGNAAEIAKRKLLAKAMTAVVDQNGAIIPNLDVTYPYLKLPPKTNLMMTQSPGTLKLSLINVTGANCATGLSYDGPGKGAYFDINDKGELVFFKSNQTCHYQKVDACIQLMPLTPPPASTLAGVIQAAATPFSDQWDLDATVYDYPSPLFYANKYERGEKGKWRVASNHRYKSDLLAGSKGPLGAERIYRGAGVFKEFQLFNFQDIAANDPTKWLQASQVTKYSPNGEAMEEKDIANKLSTAKFGYNHILPTLLAHNAAYDQVQFESFEKVYNSGKGLVLEDGLLLGNSDRINTDAHAGNYSVHLDLKAGQLPLKMVKGAVQPSLLKVWVKEMVANPVDMEPGEVHPFLKAYVGNTAFDFTKVAQTGDWSLYQATMTTLGDFTPVIGFNVLKNFSGVLIDDVRLQPQNATMSAYVYDAVNMRLLATFDDQHFGLYYQYTPEGKLMRKFIETEKGKKTITETQYHTVEQTRN